MSGYDFGKPIPVDRLPKPATKRTRRPRHLVPKELIEVENFVNNYQRDDYPHRFARLAKNARGDIGWFENVTETLQHASDYTSALLRIVSDEQYRKR